MFDRAKLFDRVRADLFGGKLAQHQVEGIEAVLDAWELAPPEPRPKQAPDLRWLAYMLGTAFHETAKTMQPIREFGHGHGHRYGIPDPKTGQTYYGRGLVQLTWLENYERFGKFLGIDLVHNPELACEMEHAVAIMFLGMTEGLFTGKRLRAYFGPGLENWVGARRIINGLDCAETIATHAQKFHAALVAARRSP